MKLIFFFCLSLSSIYSEAIEKKHLVTSAIIFFGVLLIFIIIKIVYTMLIQFNANKNPPQNLDSVKDFSESEIPNEYRNLELDNDIEKFFQDKIIIQKTTQTDFDSDNDSDFKKFEGRENEF